MYTDDLVPRLFSFKCPLCNDGFETRAELNQHTRNLHTNHNPMNDNLSNENKDNGESKNDSESKTESNQDTTFRCKKCDQRFETRYKLRKHMKDEHSREKDHKCSECDYRSSRKGDITRHYNVVHKQEKTWVCVVDDCEWTTAYKRTYQIHLRKKHKMEDIKCGIGECKYKTPCRTDLEHHRTKKHIKPLLKCDECLFSSTEKYRLKRHIIRVHKKHLAKKYKCTHGNCDSEFFTAAHLRRHVKAKHQQRRDRKCPHCDKAFTHDWNMKRHIKACKEKLTQQEAS
jgi:KRAB domain-containing zinc finger protein